jgi:glutamyl-tRNA synthetase
MSHLRVRFAPSPSGSGIHLGNAKTALFNFLFAKKYDANFLFRIEDSDQTRVNQDGADNILQELAWLGITFTSGYKISDKDPSTFTQSGRQETYRKFANNLLEKGLAYKCYCSFEDLDKARAEATAKDPKQPWRYPGTCRNLTKDFDKEHIIRFKAPTEGAIEFEDLVFGKRVIPNKENYDFVILRKDGSPMFTFCNAIDDGAIDGVSHVIRGLDHLKNTNQQIMFLEALGIARPKYAHLPMMLNSKGEKLSKRDGAVSVREFKDLGYTPDAILNYIVRFGWSCKGGQEVYSLNELIEKFSLEGCGRSDGKFDPKKFLAINYEHLRQSNLTSDQQYIARVLPFLVERGIKDPNQERMLAALPLVRSRAHTLVEAALEFEPFLLDEVKPIPAAEITENRAAQIKSLLSSLTAAPDWTEGVIKESVKNWLTKNELTLKEVGGFLRLALMGRGSSPELFQVMQALGRERSLQRISKSIEGA